MSFSALQRDLPGQHRYLSDQHRAFLDQQAFLIQIRLSHVCKGPFQGDIELFQGKAVSCQAHKGAFSGQHTSYSVKQRVFLSQTGLSKVRKGPSQTVKRPSESKNRLSQADEVFS